jgi:hypothetical protein
MTGVVYACRFCLATCRKNQGGDCCKQGRSLAAELAAERSRTAAARGKPEKVLEGKVVTSLTRSRSSQQLQKVATGVYMHVPCNYQGILARPPMKFCPQCGRPINWSQAPYSDLTSGSSGDPGGSMVVHQEKGGPVSSSGRDPVYAGTQEGRRAWREAQLAEAAAVNFDAGRNRGYEGGGNPLARKLDDADRRVRQCDRMITRALDALHTAWESEPGSALYADRHNREAALRQAQRNAYGAQKHLDRLLREDAAEMEWAHRPDSPRWPANWFRSADEATAALVHETDPQARAAIAAHLPGSSAWFERMSGDDKDEHVRESPYVPVMGVFTRKDD